jgi:5-methyltetrahydrofolate--homocysteine methyltransferase
MNADDLTGLFVELDEDAVLAEVGRRAQQGISPLEILEDCKRGIFIVGQLYQAGEYFLSGLIMAGEIFAESMEILEPLLSADQGDANTHSVLLATVEGDIHDLGKNIVDILLRSAGFTVHDLGVDVPAEEVAEKVLELRPQVVGLSAVLTSAQSATRRTVAKIRGVEKELGRPVPIIVGGGQITARVCARLGADAWTNDAVDGLEKIEGLIQSSTSAR